jgi:hypothetical protein
MLPEREHEEDLHKEDLRVPLPFLKLQCMRACCKERGTKSVQVACMRYPKIVALIPAT